MTTDQVTITFDVLRFNKWSLGRIAAGRKVCASRSKVYNDPRVYLVLYLPLCVVRDYLWKEEGADSPEEFERVWRGIHRGRFDPMKVVCVHFGRFEAEEAFVMWKTFSMPQDGRHLMEGNTYHAEKDK